MEVKTTEVFVATPSDTSAQDLIKEVAGELEGALYDDFKFRKNLYTAYDEDLNDLGFTMAEKFATKRLTKPCRAFKIRIKFEVEELAGKG